MHQLTQGRLTYLLIFLISLSLFCTSFQSGSLQAHATTGNSFSWDNATVYFVIVDRFYNGNTANDQSFGRKKVDTSGSNIGTFHGGDFKGLTVKLNEGYFTNLGVNALWVTAPYEQIHGWVSGGSTGEFAHYAYHGYYPLDWTAMDPNFGTIAEFREFVDTAHTKGIRVVLDVVMNHVGYGTLKDMATYGFGGPDAIKYGHSWDPIANGLSFGGMHGLIDYDSASAWSGWWSKWVRAGLPGYTPAPPLADDEIKGQLAYLPDLRTDLKTSVGLPPILLNKWKKETSGFEKWNLPKAAQLRADQNVAPADYIVRWLTAWVEEFGIDGFRVDTAKHVELWRWKQLSDEADLALKRWRAANPNKPGAAWTDDFWMTAEVFGLGIGKNDYHTKGGFDSTINFKFQSEPSYLNKIDETYRTYVEVINRDPSANVLSYISSHDTLLYDREDLFNGGTALLLAPGGVQIFYGDETARPFGKTATDKDQGSRSAMNWSQQNKSLLNHWQKIGTFRNKHHSVGAGEHKKLADQPYTFSRSYDKNGVKDRVVVVFGGKGQVAVQVAGVFVEGATIRDHYTKRTAIVQNGKVTLHASANGLMLLEEAKADNVNGLPTAPVGLTFSPAGKLTWNEVAGAKNYRIYVNSEWIGTTANGKTNQYTLNTRTWKKGQPYQLEVSASNDVGEGALSKLLNGVLPRDVIRISGKMITVNGKPLASTAPMQTIQGRTYVPFKALFDMVGVNSSWNNQTKTLTATQTNFSLALKLGAKSAVLNGKSVKLDAPMTSINGTTYVPLRFVGDALDASVQFVK